MNFLAVGVQGGTERSSASPRVQLNFGPASNLAFTAPTGLAVGTNRTQTINALDYATETHSRYTISCGDATAIDTTELSTVTRTTTGSGCVFTITPKNVQGTASFTIPYTSISGTVNGVFSIEVGPPSTITYQAPTGLSVASDLTLAVDASTYASDGSYTIFCGDATNIDTTELNTVVRTTTGNGCTFTVTPKAVQGAASFTVPYRSAGGHTLDGVINLQVGAPSLVFTAPATNPLVQSNSSDTIDLSAYATAGSSAISCGTVTESSALISISSQNGCNVVIAAGSSTGTAMLTVPYMSAAGASLSASLSVDVVPASNITFTAPLGLQVGTNRTRVINALDYVTETYAGYTISCGDATAIDTTELDTVARTTTGNGCVFTITPKNVQGTASFTVPYSSTGGDTENGVFSIEVGPASNIAFQAPTGLNTGRNTALEINALNYVTEDPAYTVSCGDATSIDNTRLTSVTHTGSSCTFTVTPISTLSSTLQATAATFTVPYSSTGGATATGQISVTIGPDSSLTYTAPTGLKVGRNRTLAIDALAAISGEDSSYTVNCADATGVDTAKMTVTRGTGANRCVFTVDPVNNLMPANQGDTTFSVVFTSTGGATATGQFTVNIGPDSTITYNSPGTLTVGRNRTRVIDASDYVSEADGNNTITCSDAAGVDNTKLTSVARTANTCSFTIDPVDALTPGNQGDTTFDITFTSDGGHSITRTITVNVGPDSTIVFTAPASNPAIAASRTRTIDVSSYAADGSYTISCGTITENDPDITLGTQDGCRIPITAGSASGQTADISIPYSSSGGHTTTGTLTLDVGAASAIVFNAPTGLKVGTNRTQTINALDYATDGGYTITCAAATNTAANMPTSGTVALASVARDATGSGCNYTITPTATQGTATFTIPYTSAGGDTANGNISIEVGPPSNINFAAPSTLRIARNLTLAIDALGYISGENSAYTVTCGDATGVASARLAVTHTGNSCDFTIDPVDSLGASMQGTTSFNILYTSDGGATATGRVSVNIGPDSSLTFTDPGTFTLGRNRTLEIDALAATSGEDAAYTVSCADATGVDTNKMTVTRSSSGNGCSFTVDPVNNLAPGSQGDTTFSVAYTSTGGATATGTFTVNIGPDSTITYTAPPSSGANRLQIGRNLTLTIDAASYVGETSGSSYTITCSDASNITGGRLTSVTRTANTCSYTIDPINSASAGNASFTITYTSTGGHTITRAIAVYIGPNSSITYNAPPTSGANQLLVGRNQTLEVDASAYVSEASSSGYTISCGDATGIDTTRLTSVTHTGSSCTFTVTPISTLTSSLQSTAATFTVPFTSTGGATANGVISVKIGPDSNLTYNAPTGLKVGRNRTLAIDAAAAITGENAAYSVRCADATGVDTTRLTSVNRSSSGGGCSFTVDPINNLAAGSQGNATFTVAFTSTGGATTTGQFTVNIGPDSTITYTGPGVLSVGRNRTRVIDASDYVSEADSNNTISCSDADGVDNNRLTSLSRTANTCSFTIDPIDTLATNLQGNTTFRITFTSDGGHVITRTITVYVGPDSDIVFAAPASNPAIAASRTRTIDVSSYATDGNYAISCGTITENDPDISLGTQDGCRIPITAGSTSGQTADISIPYSSSGGATRTSTLTLDVGAASAITFNAPTGLKVGTNRTQTINALDYATDGGYTITCGTATNIAANAPTSGTVALASVARDATGTGCNYTITPTATQGTATFTIPYTSDGGDTASGNISIQVGPPSNIRYRAPFGLRVGRNLTLAINALDYISGENSAYTVTCGDATGAAAARLSVTHTGNSCDFTIDPVDSLAPSLQGATSFSIPYTSDGGATATGRVTVNIGPDSALTFTDPGTFTLGRNQTLVIDALAAVSGESSTYRVSCADATGVDANKMTVTRSSSGNGCSFTVDPVDTLALGSQGDTTFSVAFTSTGGATASGTFTVNIGPDSTIAYTAPEDLLVGRNRSLEVDLSSAAVDSGGYTVACGAAAGLHSRLFSVTRADAQSSPCVFSVTPRSTASQGTASFSVPFTSQGGDTETGTVALTVGRDSEIVFNPPSLAVGNNRTRAIDALDYARDGNYAISCGDAANTAANVPTSGTVALTSVVRDASGNGCGYTITPTSTQGTATFTISYTSTGGHTLDANISITVGPASTITLTVPPASGAGSLSTASNRQLVIDASGYASEASSDYTISCGDPASISANIDRVERDRCSYTITPAATGTATFTVPYASTGGHAVSGTITVAIGAASDIVFVPPVGLRVAASSSLVVDADSYTTDGSYTITCGDAESISGRLASVMRSGCDYTAMSAASLGEASFVVPYTSSGGDTFKGRITITIGPASTTSSILFVAPQGLTARAGGSAITIDASRYAADADGTSTISCGTATGVDATRITVSNTNCSYQVTAAATASGSASLTVPYSSSGGASRNGTINVAITPASDIVFTAPTGLEIGAGSTRTVSLSSHAADGSYTITCGNATAAEAAKLTSVSRNGCDFTITAAAAAAQGDTTFSFTYTSRGGDTHAATITITIGAASSIVFTPPAQNFRVPATTAVVINAASYAADGSYTIGCEDATGIDPKLASVTRSGCDYTATAGSVLGEAVFTVSYTSTGGDTARGIISLTIISAPQRPQPAAPDDQTPSDTDPQPARTPDTRTPERTEPEHIDAPSGWNTFTVQAGGTTARTIRRTLGLPANQAFYTWNAETQTWTRITSPARTIPAGTTISFHSKRGLGTDELETASLGHNTQRTSLASGWNIINTAASVARAGSRDFLVDDSLTDCDRMLGVIAVVSYNPRTQRWSLYLPCHPRSENRLTTGANPPYDLLTSIEEGDTTYIYTRTRQPVEIAWNTETQTYQPVA